MSRRKLAALTGVALVAVAGFSIAYLRSHSTDTLRGTYQGKTWQLSVTRDWYGTCMQFSSEDGGATAACGFSKVERAGAGEGPAGSSVVFGPLPADAVTVTMKRDSGSGIAEIQVHRFSGILAQGRYFLAFVPRGTGRATLAFQNSSGTDVTV